MKVNTIDKVKYAHLLEYRRGAIDVVKHLPFQQLSHDRGASESEQSNHSVSDSINESESHDDSTKETVTEVGDVAKENI